MKKTSLLALALLTGCSTPQYYQGFQTGRDYYGTLNKREQKVFNYGADFATNDYMQRLYAAERRSQQYDLTGARKKTVRLERKIVPIQLDRRTDPDGVIHDPETKWIEVHTVQ